MISPQITLKTELIHSWEMCWLKAWEMISLLMTEAIAANNAAENSQYFLDLIAN